MSRLVIYGICGIFGVLQIIVGIYWLYVIIRDHYKSHKKTDPKILSKMDMKSMKSMSASIPSKTAPIMPDSPSISPKPAAMTLKAFNLTSESQSTTVQTKRQKSVKNTASLPFQSKLYTTISILGYTLYCIWVIGYFIYTYLADNADVMCVSVCILTHILQYIIKYINIEIKTHNSNVFTECYTVQYFNKQVK